MAYVEITKDFSKVKKTIPGLSFTVRQVVAIAAGGAVGIPVFLLLYLRFGLDTTIATLGLFLAGGPVAFAILFERNQMGIEKWLKIIIRCKFTHNTDRVYETENLYETRERLTRLSKEVDEIMFKGLSDMERRKKANEPKKEVKINGQKIKVPMSGKIDYKTKKELEKAVKKAKLKGKIPRTIQDTIPYERPYIDGIIEHENGYFTKTIRFEDISYQLLDEDPQRIYLKRWKNLLNFFDSDIHFQFNYGKMEMDKDLYSENFKVPPQNDAFDVIRKEYSDMLTGQFKKGTNSLRKEMYLTYGIHANGIKNARLRLERIDKALIKLFGSLDSKAKVLNGYERLELLHRIFHPGTKDKLFWNFDMPIKTGLSSKDFIAPEALSFKGSEFNNAKYFKMGDRICAVSYFEIYSAGAEDRVLADILSLDSNVWVSIQSEVLERERSISKAKDDLNDIQGKIQTYQKHAVRTGFDMDLLPPELKPYETGATARIKAIESKDEQMINTTILIMQSANSRKELESNIFELGRILSTYQGKLERTYFMQE